MANDYHIQKLKECIEVSLNKRLVTPKDFNFLSENIFLRLNVMLSPTTIKRIWGYLNEENHPRESTLSILSQFIGYRDWDSFKKSSYKENNIQSNLIFSRKLSAYALAEGDVLILTWLPNRFCKIRHIKDCFFEIIESKNSKLEIGDTFKCSIFIEGEPLYIDHLKHGIYNNIAYVAGKKDGIRFELVMNDANSNVAINEKG